MALSRASRFILRTAALLLSSAACYADMRFQPLWESYGKELGIVAGEVVSFAQDQDGYLYAGTGRGLLRFDGKRFSLLDTEPSLAQESIALVRFDRLGRLWATVNNVGVCTISGKAYEKLRSECFTQDHREATRRLPDNQVFSFEEWQQHMWLAVFDHGVYQIDQSSLRIKQHISLPNNRVLGTGIYADQLWLATMNGELQRVDKDLQALAPIAVGETISYLHTHDNRLFASALSTGNLLEISAAGVVTKHAIPGVRTISFLTSLGDELLLTTNLGLLRGMPGADWQRYRSFGSAPGAMPEGSILTLFTDQQRGIWVGSMRSGAARLNSMDTPYTWLLRGDSGLPTASIAAASYADDGRLWIATGNRGVLGIYPDGTIENQAFSLLENQGSTRARSIRCVGNTVWVGHQQGLTRYDPDARRTKVQRWQDDGEIRLVEGIEVMPDGGAWISSGFSALVRLDAQLRERQRIAGADRSTVIEQFLVRKTQDQDEESLWWADDKGFHMHVRGQQTLLQAELGLGVAHCKSDDSIWFAGRNGFTAFDAKTRQVKNHLRYPVASSSDVGGLWCDRFGDLYFSGHLGVYRWRKGTPEPERLDIAENAAEFIDQPFTIADGAMLLASTRGLMRIDLARLRQRDGAQQQDFPLRLAPMPGLVSWRDPSLTLSADALSFQSPAKTLYEFTAAQGDTIIERTGWQASSVHRFERLPPGTLQFDVRARNVAGHIMRHPRQQLEVQIAPWRTPAAWLGYILSALSILFFLVRRRDRALRRQAALVVSELKARQATELALSRTESLKMISHEMRNLLSGIYSTMPLIESANEPAQRAQWLRQVNSAMGSLNRLLDDALDFTKLMSGQVSLLPGRCDIALLVQDCVDAHQSSAAEKSLALSFSGSVEPAIRWLDATRIRQIVSNLINNAIKYTDTGAIQVRLQEATAQSESAPLALEITVQDTGIGIPQAQRALVFEPYTRLHRARQGTGLGLAVCAKLVQVAGGSIRAEPAPNGCGSLFRLHLPAPLPPSDAPATVDAIAPDIVAPQAPVEIQSEASMRVLLLAGNAADAELVDLACAQLGGELMRSDSAFDALLQTQSAHIDAVFLADVAQAQIYLELAQITAQSPALFALRPDIFAAQNTQHPTLRALHDALTVSELVAILESLKRTEGAA
jgi:signal transduction histidine kinase/ligand-binding sensor domain-containing protein